MSIWLSAAKAWAARCGGFGTAEMRRQQTAMINEMSRQVVRFLDGCLGPAFIQLKERQETALT